MTRKELQLLDQLVRTHGYSGLVAELSAHAMREAHELEMEPDPRRFAALLGDLVLEAEIMGRCADHLASLEGD